MHIHDPHTTTTTTTTLPYQPQGYSCHPAELPPRDVGGYFTLVFLR